MVDVVEVVVVEGGKVVVVVELHAVETATPRTANVASIPRTLHFSFK